MNIVILQCYSTLTLLSKEYLAYIWPVGPFRFLVMTVGCRQRTKSSYGTKSSLHVVQYAFTPETRVSVEYVQNVILYSLQHEHYISQTSHIYQGYSTPGTSFVYKHLFKSCRGTKWTLSKIVPFQSLLKCVNLKAMLYFGAFLCPLNPLKRGGCLKHCFAY